MAGTSLEEPSPSPISKAARYRRAYVERAFRRLRRNRRNRCLVCWFRHGLQWAHRHPTGLSGEGRGSLHRLFDVMKHPRAYALLCLDCHKLFDAGILKPPSRGDGWRCEIASRIEIRAALEPRRYAFGKETGVGEGGAIARSAYYSFLDSQMDEERFRSEARSILSKVVGYEYWRPTPSVPA